jgi:benzoylformate decarboxylase
VQLLDSGQIVLQQMTFGAGKKQTFSTNGQSLGWALAAALGVKLARGRDPVVALMGDGDFLFGGSQALWTAQRYQIPITVVVLNNRSYDNERNRIWSRDSRQAELNRDMTSYLGDPDVRYGELAAAYDVEAELIAEPKDLEGAIERAQAANRDGRSYLIDVLVSRRGLGADSSWYPAYSLASQRTSEL